MLNTEEKEHFNRLMDEFGLHLLTGQEDGEDGWALCNVVVFKKNLRDLYVWMIEEFEEK